VTAHEHERAFELLGSEVRLLVGPSASKGEPPPEVAALRVEAFLRSYHRRLTRFEAGSELSALNASPSRSNAVSPLLAVAVRAALWAAERSSGLVDPTLVWELEHAGYARSRVGVKPAPLAEALAAAPPRRPALPRVDRRWRAVSVDKALVVTRPPGVRIDTGGTGKGLAADLCGSRLAGYASFAVDAGGDLRIGGASPAPRVVEVASPFTGETVASFTVLRGAVATSGISTRLWRTEDGFAHHLLDPSNGHPAWTGVVQATALGETAVEAETLAKMALLSGAQEGERLLEALGGVLVLDDGGVVAAGPLTAEAETCAVAA
jgi:thiamine biosynthesis lipoprotein